MLSGVINAVTVAPFPGLPAPLPAAVAGDLVLVESALDPFQPNQFTIQSTTNPNEYIIAGEDGTQVQVNGGPIASQQTVNLVTGRIFAMPGPSGDTIRFLPQSPTADSTVPVDLVFVAAAGDTIELGDFLNNFDTGVTINGELALLGVAAGLTTFRMQNCTVVGPSVFLNAPGGTMTTVIDCDFLGSPTFFPLSLPIPVAPIPGGGAFAMVNGAGADFMTILGDSSFGAGIATVVPPPGPALTIADASVAGGGSQIFFGPVNPLDTTRIDVFGALGILNSANLAGVIDFISIDQTDVTGFVLINNNGGPGGSSVIVQDSNFGTNLLPVAPAIGSPTIVLNGAGQDSLTVAGSSFPWGLFVTHAVPGAVPPFWPVTAAGSFTQITDSQIGTRAGGPTTGLPVLPPPFAGVFGIAGYVAGLDALLIQGDQGRDIVNLEGNQIGGAVRVELHNGNNDFTLRGDPALTSPTVVPAVFYNATFNGILAPNVNGFGIDNVLISDVSIPIATVIFLGPGSDSLQFRGNTVLANPLLGGIILHGGLGTDGIGADVTVLPTGLLVLSISFEIPIP